MKDCDEGDSDCEEYAVREVFEEDLDRDDRNVVWKEMENDDEKPVTVFDDIFILTGDLTNHKRLSYT